MLGGGRRKAVVGGNDGVPVIGNNRSDFENTFWILCHKIDAANASYAFSKEFTNKTNS